jgi:zinc transport system substrate-binding protein
MRFFLKFFFAFFIFCAAFIENSSAKNPTILTSINPIYQIVLAITKDPENSILIINPNVSEHDYQLKKSDAEAVSKADLIFYVSHDLENSFLKLTKNSGKESQTFELAKINDIKLLQRRNDVKKIDPHIWLDPQNSIKIAEFITQKISEIDGQNSKKYQKNLAKFTKEILAMQKNIQKNLAAIKDKENFCYIFYHDGYQYFEDAFGIKPLKVVSYSHGSDLTVKSLKEIDDLMKTKSVKCIFGEPQDEKNSAMKLAEKYKIKFSILDEIGSKKNVGENGYAALMVNLSNDLLDCLK